MAIARNDWIDDEPTVSHALGPSRIQSQYVLLLVETTTAATATDGTIQRDKTKLLEPFFLGGGQKHASSSSIRGGAPHLNQDSGPLPVIPLTGGRVYHLRLR
jgi:hypothetical protein